MDEVPPKRRSNNLLQMVPGRRVIYSPARATRSPGVIELLALIGQRRNEVARRKWESAVKTRRIMDKYKMRIFPGHDDKIIVPADNEAGYVLEPIAEMYD